MEDGRQSESRGEAWNLLWEGRQSLYPAWCPGDEEITSLNKCTHQNGNKAFSDGISYSEFYVNSQ